MNLQIGKTEIVVGTPVAELDTPALLVDAAALESNVAAMAKLVGGRPVRLRPHAKTHKSIAIAQMQIATGAVGVCCAKLAEAEAIAANGTVSDIYVTTPIVGPAKLARLEKLLRVAKVTVVVDNIVTLEPLAAVAARTGRTIDVIVEVDVGQQRCGVPSGPAAARIADAIAQYERLTFKGLHGYQGKLQMVASYEERRNAVKSALGLLTASAEHCRQAGHKVDILTGGGSGSLAIDLELGGLNELQPGSYVFMDANYSRVVWDPAGTPPPFTPALFILGSVVSKPAADRVVIDIGWKTASSDAGPPVPERSDLVFDFAGDEHGHLRRRDGKDLDLAVGDKVKLIPSHCDTTVNLFSDYTVVRNGVFEKLMPVDGRGASQ